MRQGQLTLLAQAKSVKAPKELWAFSSLDSGNSIRNLDT